MKPLGRRAVVPDAHTLKGFGVITGTVVQSETGDALQGAAVSLARAPDTPGQSQPERGTNANGGFVFDSVLPGRYQVHVRKLREYQDSVTIQATAGQLDTAYLRMRAYRCYGY